MKTFQQLRRISDLGVDLRYHIADGREILRLRILDVDVELLLKCEQQFGEFQRVCSQIVGYVRRLRNRVGFPTKLVRDNFNDSFFCVCHSK